MAKDKISEIPKEITLEGLCKKISNHLFGCTILNMNDIFVDEIFNVEVTNIDVVGSLAT